MLDFPNSPTLGQIFPSPATQGVGQWQWSGTAWAPLGLPAGAFSCKVQTFQGAGNYTYIPTRGMQFCIIENQAAGGGAGGCGSAASASYAAGGGGAGGYAKAIRTAAQIGASQPITVGAGGAGANGNNPGTAGGATNVGTICSANGGAGGSQASAATVGLGGLGGAATAGDILLTGMNGGGGSGFASAATGNIFVGGNGGSTPFGSGGRGRLTGSAGSTGGDSATANSGGGGGGGSINASTTLNTGGNGADGCVVITEYGNFGGQYSPPVRGEINGLTLSCAGSSPTFTIQAGAATDSTYSYSIVLPSNWTKTASAWALGPGSGSLDTGTVAVTTWYHVHLIMNPLTGAVDVLTSRSATAPTLPSGFTLFRRVGSMFYSGTGPGWLYFMQNGDVFRWGVGRMDVSGVSPTNGAQNTVTLTVPGDGVTVEALLMASCQYLSGGGTTLKLFGGYMTAQPTIGLYAAVASNSNSCSFQVTTNGSSQILSRLDYGGTGTAYSIETLGWIDTRGRFT